MTMQNRSAAVALTAAFLALSPSVLSADVLVTRRGVQVETRGAWEVEGKLIVFNLLGGSLASLQVSEVDLTASHRVTNAAISAARNLETAPPPAEPRAARVVITDESLRHVPRPVAPGSVAPVSSLAPEVPVGAEEEVGEEEGRSAVPATRIVVTSWERSKETGRVLISGSLRNDAPDEASGVSIIAFLYDGAGRLLASGKSVLSSRVLPAGQSAAFQAELPAASGFATVKFQVRGVHLLPSRSQSDNIVTSGNKNRT